MSINFDKVGKKLHGKIDSGIHSLKAAQSHLETIQKETEEAVQVKLSAAREALDEKKRAAATAKVRLEEFAEAKKVESKNRVAEWKKNRHKNKLEKRAEQAEMNAADSIDIMAVYAADAEVAILEAVAARRDADEA